MPINKWSPELTKRERNLLEKIPKATLYVVARQLGALALGAADDLDEGAQMIFDEWCAQYRSGNVPQKPPKTLPWNTKEAD